MEDYEDWDIPQTASDPEIPQAKSDEAEDRQTENIDEQETVTAEQGTEDSDAEQEDKK